MVSHRSGCMRHHAIKESKELLRPRRKPSRRPHLFGRGGRDRALVALAVNGPMHVRELARTIGSDSHKAWNMVERLRESGLVVKRDVPGGRKYAALNRELPTHPPLLRLLLALDERWPSKRVEQPTYRWRMPYDTTLSPDRLDHIFQSPVRSRTLLFIAAVGLTDMVTLYTTLGLDAVSALYAVNHWEREGGRQEPSPRPASLGPTQSQVRRGRRIRRVPRRTRAKERRVSDVRGNGATAHRTNLEGST